MSLSNGMDSTNINSIDNDLNQNDVDAASF